MNDQTLLYRQVHPSWVQQGRVTSQAFRPTPKDENKLSLYDGDKVTAEKSWHHFTTVLSLTSAGVLAISMSDCKSVNLSPTPDPIPFPEHVILDFGALNNNGIAKVSKTLRNFADKRGWQFRSETPTNHVPK